MNPLSTSNINNNDLKQEMYWTQLDQAELADSKAKKIHDIITASYSALNTFYETKVQVQSDNELTPAGMRSRIETAGNRALAIIQNLSKPALAEIDGDIQRLDQALLRAAIGEADDASRTLLKIEARTLAAQIDPLLLEPQYLALCESGDDLLTCEAIEQAPAIGKMLRTDVLERGRIMRAAKLHPDQAEALRQAREARSILASAVDQARSSLGAPFLSAADIQVIAGQASVGGDEAAAA